MGDEATVGHRPLPATGTRGTEEAVILFRAGRFRVTVTWADYADLPNVDDALQVARLVERRVRAAPR